MRADNRELAHCVKLTSVSGRSGEPTNEERGMKDLRYDQVTLGYFGKDAILKFAGKDHNASSIRFAILMAL